MSVVISTYLVANVAYVAVLTPNQMLESPAVAVVSRHSDLYDDDAFGQHDRCSIANTLPNAGVTSIGSGRLRFK